MHTNAIITASSLPAEALIIRGWGQVTPYRAGFEDCLYDHKYQNPYPARSTAWAEYEQGNQDANASLKERVL